MSKKTKKQLEAEAHFSLQSFRDIKYPVRFPIDSSVFPEPRLSKSAGILYGYLQLFTDHYDLEKDGWVTGWVYKEEMELIGFWMKLPFTELRGYMVELYERGWIDVTDYRKENGIETQWDIIIFAHPRLRGARLPKFRTPIYMFNK